LGIGIYTPPEAALYARVPTAKLSRWVLGTNRDKPAVYPQLEREANTDRWVTFIDLVQSMAIRDIREAAKAATSDKESVEERVSLAKIRRAINFVYKEYGIEYPLARRHTTFLYGDRIVIDVEGRGMVDATGKDRHHLNLPPVVVKFAKDLSYDASGLAAEYRPFEWKGHSIVLNPHHRFGEPLVESCRYTARTLFDAYQAEGGSREAARAYGVKESEVEAAYYFYTDYLGEKTAA
jgi:uncharacterized protein (DUF433 family)